MNQNQLDMSAESESEGEFQKQEKEIAKIIDKYKEKRKNHVYKQLTNAFFNYEYLLESSYASPIKYTWLADKKKVVNELKNEKAIQNREKYVNKEDINDIRNDIMPRIANMDRDLEEAIQYSTYIRVELDKQITDLNRVYDINKDTTNRLNRAMDGLRTMLRRIMLSKMTRFLTILTVLAIIALIVIYILSSNGIL